MHSKKEGQKVTEKFPRGNDPKIPKTNAGRTMNA